MTAGTSSAAAISSAAASSSVPTVASARCERTTLTGRKHLGDRTVDVAQRRVVDRADDRSANQRMPEGHPPGGERDHPLGLHRLEVGERHAEP